MTRLAGRKSPQPVHWTALELRGNDTVKPCSSNLFQLENLRRIPSVLLLTMAGNVALWTRNERQQRTKPKMKTKTYHISNLGKFAPGGCADSTGYVTYHDSPRYRTATEDQLSMWAESRTKAVRNAAYTEMAERALSEWRGK